MLNKQHLFGNAASGTDRVDRFRRESASTAAAAPRVNPALQQQTSAASAERAGAVGETPAPLAAEPEKERGSRLTVGPDIKLKGAEITDCDTLVVEGHVEASMDSRVIRIAERGTFVGTVGIDVAQIHGSFEGELTARKQLIVHAGGCVRGKVRYGKLVIEEGGELCGDVATLDDAQRTHASKSVASASAAPAAAVSAPVAALQSSAAR